MLILACVFAGVVVVLAVYERHRPSPEVCRDWDALLDPTQRKLLRSLESQAEVTSGMLRDGYLAALQATREEALRLLDLSVCVIEEATADRVARLRALARCARMLSSVLPLPPLVPGRFRLSGVRSLTAAARLIHFVLTGSTARMQLRVAVLSAAFQLVRRGASTAARTARRSGGRIHAGDRLKAVIGDFGGLDLEHVESVRAVLASAALFARDDDPHVALHLRDHGH